MSSLGSVTFFICLMAALLNRGMGPDLVSLVIAIPRLTSVAILTFFGPKLDGWPIRRFLILTEGLAAFLSVLILVLWPKIEDFFIVFLICLSLRSALINLQTAGRTRLIRDFSGESEVVNSRTAVALNQAIHGAFFFAAVLSLMAHNVDLRYIIIFDFLTFVLGGLVALTLNEVKPIESKVNRPFDFFDHLYKFAPTVAVFDLALSIVFCGLSILIYKMSLKSSIGIVYLNLAYGFGVWVAGYLEKQGPVRKAHSIFWMILVFCFLGLSLTISNYFLMMIFACPLFITYWILYHRYSGLIQIRAPRNLVGGISAARGIQMISILIVGELIFGKTSEFLPLPDELTLRAVICLLIFVSAHFFKKRLSYEK